MKRALVTGAGGFLGQHLLAALAAAGTDVVTAGTRSGGPHHCRIEDVCDRRSWSRIVDDIRPDAVFHLAGSTRADTMADLLRVNAAFAAALIEAVADSPAREAVLVLVGSSAEYGAVAAEQLPIRETVVASPDTNYGISKYAQTLLGLAAARRDMKVVIPRPFNIVGPGMPAHLALADFAQQVVSVERGERAPVLSVGNLATSRDFVDVRDAAHLLPALAVTEAAQGGVVNLCSGRPVAMRDLVGHLIAASGLDIRIEVDARRFRPVDTLVSYGSTALLEQLTGRRPDFSPDKACADILADIRRRTSA